MAALAALAWVSACSSPEPGLVWRDNDDFDIPEPAFDDSAKNEWSDNAYWSVVFQAQKALDIGWLLRKARVLPREQAVNVNALDEVPDSTWFTNRHGSRRMELGELAAGPPGAQPSPPLTVLENRSRRRPSFVVRDALGASLHLQFDPLSLPGIRTNGDLLVSRLLYAAGYNVAPHRLLTLDPQELSLARGATSLDRYNHPRPLTAERFDELLESIPRNVDGKLLANARLAIAGQPKGPWSFYGTRKDDPNDTVRHEDRRELRGLRLFMAWLNNTDTRRRNRVDTYTEVNGRRFLAHYLMGFSSALGSARDTSKGAYSGSVYRIDPGYVLSTWATLGIEISPNERAAPVSYPSVGFFDSLAFDPFGWRPDYPVAAFEKLTARDAFWAAKIITAFTDEDVRAIVASGYFPEPGAAEYMVRMLCLRRDSIGLACFDLALVNPLDSFEVVEGALLFDDLAVDRGYARASDTSYRIRLDDGHERITSLARVPLGESQVEVRIETSRGQGWSPPLRVRLAPLAGRLQPVRIWR